MRWLGWPGNQKVSGLMLLCFFKQETLLTLFYFTPSQCWASYFVKVTSYILLATKLFSYSYILPIK